MISSAAESKVWQSYYQVLDILGLLALRNIKKQSAVIKISIFYQFFFHEIMQKSFFEQSQNFVKCKKSKLFEDIQFYNV